MEAVEWKLPEYSRGTLGEREFKKEIRQTILEYFDSKDVAKVGRIVRKLGPLKDEREGELVRKIYTFAMERSGAECELKLKLIVYLRAHEKIDTAAVARDFGQLYAGMEDLILDVPDAKEMAKSFVVQAKERDLLPKGWEPGQE